MSDDEKPERYVVTEEQLEDLIYHHQEIIRCAFQRYSTTNAQLKADQALRSCKSLVLIENPALEEQ